jgi:hypothetical protein
VRREGEMPRWKLCKEEVKLLFEREREGDEPNVYPSLLIRCNLSLTRMYAHTTQCPHRSDHESAEDHNEVTVKGSKVRMRKRKEGKEKAHAWLMGTPSFSSS